MVDGKIQAYEGEEGRRQDAAALISNCCRYIRRLTASTSSRVFAAILRLGRRELSRHVTVVQPNGNSNRLTGFRDNSVLRETALTGMTNGSVGAP